MTGAWTVRSITGTLLPVLLVLTTLELGGGLVLGSLEETLLAYPSLLVLVPVTIGTAGNLGSVLASRLSTALHLGLLSFDPTDPTLAGNAITTLLLAVSVFPLVGVGAWSITWGLGTVRLPATTVVWVSVCSGLALAALTVLVTVVAAAVTYRVGANPDEVLVPVVTNLCDVLGVLVLFGVVRVVVG